MIETIIPLISKVKTLEANNYMPSFPLSFLIMYIHNNFGSFYFPPLNDMYIIIEYKISVIRA